MDNPKVKNLVDFGKIIISISKAIRERRQSRKDILDNDATPLLGFRKRVLKEFEDNDKEQDEQNETILFLLNKNKELEERISNLENTAKSHAGKASIVENIKPEKDLSEPSIPLPPPAPKQVS